MRFQIAKRIQSITNPVIPQRVNNFLRELREFINANEIEAAFIISGTGNLSRANLKFANGMVDVYRGKFDVLSISGVLSVNFQADLKISLADDTGKTFGKVLNI